MEPKLKILLEKGQYKQAYQLLNELPQSNMSSNRYYYYIGICSVRLGKYTDGINYLDDLINTYTDDSNILFLKIKSLRYLIVAYFEHGNQFSVGKLDAIRQLIPKIEDNQRKIDADIYWICCKFTYLTQNHQLKQIPKLITKGNLLIEKTDNPRIRGDYYIQLGRYYDFLGELSNALEYYKLTQEYYHDAGYIFGEANSLTNLGNIYYFKGEISKAIKAQNQARNLYKALENELYQVIVENNLALSLALTGKAEQALDILKYNLKKTRKMKSVIETGEILFRIIRITFSYQKHINHDLEVMDYYNELTELVSNHESSVLNTFYNLSKATLLKSKNRIRSQIESMLIFEEFLTREREIDFDLLLYAKISIVDLLFKELKYKYHESIIEDINQLSTDLLETGITIDSTIIIIQSHVLRGKLAYIQEDILEVKDRFQTAIDIAERKKLNRLIEYVKFERDVIERKLHKDKDSKISVISRLNNSEVEDFLNNFLIPRYKQKEDD